MFSLAISFGLFTDFNQKFRVGVAGCLEGILNRVVWRYQPVCHSYKAYDRRRKEYSWVVYSMDHEVVLCHMDFFHVQVY